MRKKEKRRVLIFKFKHHGHLNTIKQKRMERRFQHLSIPKNQTAIINPKISPDE